MSLLDGIFSPAPSDGSPDWSDVGGKPDAIVALEAAGTGANKIPYYDNSFAGALADLTAAARTFLAAANNAAQKTAIGLGSVDNTSDANKPVSTAQAAAIAAAIANLVASSPAALDTLNELATALGNDANFSTTVTNALALKAPLASPTFTGNPSVSGGQFIPEYTTTPTAAGTTTLTSVSSYLQYFTGATTQICVLPDATTIPYGWAVRIVNRSSAAVTVKDGASTTLIVVPGGTETTFTCITGVGAAGTWDLGHSTRFREGSSSTSSVGGTTTLTVTSNMNFRWTGSGSQTIVLPDTSTLWAGWKIRLINVMTGTALLTINTNASNNVLGSDTLPANTEVTLMCTSTSSNAASAWLVQQSAYNSKANPVFTGTTMTPADGQNLVLGTSTGSKIGTGTGQKIGFWNATPVVQPVSANQASVTTTVGSAVATDASALASYGYTQAQADAIVANVNALRVDVLALATLVNQLRADAVTIGTIKGSA